jgi:hypothetical protein
LFYACSATAQYDSSILGYNLYFDKLDTGQTFPTADKTITEDTTLIVLRWERGDSTTTPYVSPYNTTFYYLEWVLNTPGLWDVDTTSSAQSISFTQGMYEITCTEVDINNIESERSNPVFLWVEQIYARIPRYFLIE